MLINVWFWDELNQLDLIVTWFQQGGVTFPTTTETIRHLEQYDCVFFETGPVTRLFTRLICRFVISSERDLVQRKAYIVK